MAFSVRPVIVAARPTVTYGAGEIRVGDWLMLGFLRSEEGVTMDDNFQISTAQTSTTGDYLSFTVTDGTVKLPGKISGSALAELSPGMEREASFKANFERIRQAAYEMRRRNPEITEISLNSYSF
ncbi:hypothetical protein WI80_25015 [Burkholderia ubonensis]|nr:hypothetical protein WI80_25015 [Burkholderia ubonensis]KVD40238.1 hypothetical protein WI84_00430 [Burkholderia ubonensis]KVO73170.1 hypothetical protein WJ78_03070 [Burkholderia ubonensis]KVP46746.1 hypothetical protein WJ88_24140 [Burkholderia ubonensis]KVP83895.1 hypothetical protein WJ97_32590 [Burkholderia ubonensis]